MDSICHPSKKIRLTAEVRANDVDWGEEIEVDEDVMQEIETQGYSQHPDVGPSTSAGQDNDYFSYISAIPVLHQMNGKHVTHLKSELQVKTGEIKILRNQIEKCQSQIIEKNSVITDLKKQLDGKDTEIEMQKSKAKLSSLNSSIAKSSPIRTINYQKRFTFAGTKSHAEKDEIFNFSRRIHQGDILHRTLRTIFICEDADISNRLDLSNISGTEEVDIQHNMLLDENAFIVHLKSSLLQLCCFSCFEEIRAHQLIISILNNCELILTRVHGFLSRELILDVSTSKTIVLDRLEDTTKPRDSKDLLKYKRLFPSEKGIAARQTLTALAKIIEVHPSIAEMVIETERFKASRCSCLDHDLIMNTPHGLASISAASKDHVPTCAQISETSFTSITNEKKRWKKFLTFDVIALSHDIVQELTMRGKTANFEGVLSSILYLYSVLCNNDSSLIYQKHEMLIINTIKKMLFSLPSFVVIRDIVKFLSASSHYSFSSSLCCRSAAETFSENFRCYNFTKETCMLQVLCVYIEMMKKNPDFVCNYTSWILSSISEPHEVQWVRNKNDSKLCECLLMLEQITIKVILNCIEQFEDIKVSWSSKSLLKSALGRCVSIFQVLRRKDDDFDRNILPCCGEYKMMLQSLKEIVANQRTRNFVDQEFRRVCNERKFNLPVEREEDLVQSLLRL